MERETYWRVVTSPAIVPATFRSPDRIEPPAFNCPPAAKSPPILIPRTKSLGVVIVPDKSPPIRMAPMSVAAEMVPLNSPSVPEERISPPKAPMPLSPVWIVPSNPPRGTRMGSEMARPVLMVPFKSPFSMLNCPIITPFVAMILPL